MMINSSLIRTKRKHHDLMRFAMLIGKVAPTINSNTRYMSGPDSARPLPISDKHMHGTVQQDGLGVGQQQIHSAIIFSPFVKYMPITAKKFQRQLELKIIAMGYVTDGSGYKAGSGKITMMQNQPRLQTPAYHFPPATDTCTCMFSLCPLHS